jgi:hypothetical protein
MVEIIGLGMMVALVWLIAWLMAGKWSLKRDGLPRLARMAGPPEPLQVTDGPGTQPNRSLVQDVSVRLWAAHCRSSLPPD